MDQAEIFKKLFELYKYNTDPRGLVVACYCDSDEVLAIAPSAPDGIRHAEDLLIDEIKKNNIKISDCRVMYTTLEPCSYRRRIGLKDCTQLIIESGIKHVVFGARDPAHSETASKKFEKNGITFEQTKDAHIIRACAELYNNSLDPSVTDICPKPID